VTACPQNRVDWWLLTVPIDERIARTRIRYSHHLLARIRARDHDGWGAAPLYARAPHQVRGLRPILEELASSLDVARPADARARCAALLAAAPDVGNAVDGALWELEAIQAGCSVAALLGATVTSVPVTEQLFAAAVARPEEAWPPIRERGTRALKVKVCGDPEQDLRLLRRLRRVVGGETRLRIDANRGYSPEQARRLADGLERLGIAEWEEPAAGDFEQIAQLREQTGLRVILDESVRSRAQLEDAIACNALDVLNLKLSRLGGITAALEYRGLCGAAGVDVLLGCNEDVGPGMAAVLHAAAAWRPFETEGVGWLRLGLDVASPSPVVVDGCVEISSRPGWGLTVEPRTHGRAGPARRRLPQPVHISSWSRPYAALSVARQQHQRACNAWLRAGRLGRRTVDVAQQALRVPASSQEVPR